MTNALRTTWPYTVAGLVFYHKDGIYTAGKTPTVLWLHANAVQELLGPFYAGLNRGIAGS